MADFDYSALMNEMDVGKGDIIDVASDMMTLMAYCRKRKLAFDPNKLIDALMDCVGSEGTVMIRTFTWDFCHGTPFDIRKSPSRVGSLGNCAMRREDFKRTKHPLYSWMVWGACTENLCGMDNKASFGKDTPFDFLYKNNAKQITLGNSYTQGNTQVHHCEALAKVPYRFEKTFTGTYIDEDGVSSVREYSMFVRPLNLTVSQEVLESKEFMDKMAENGILNSLMYDGEIGISVYLLRNMTDYLVNHLINEDGSLVASINGTPGFKNANIDWKQLKY